MLLGGVNTSLFWLSHCFHFCSSVNEKKSVFYFTFFNLNIFGDPTQTSHVGEDDPVCGSEEDCPGAPRPGSRAGCSRLSHRYLAPSGTGQGVNGPGVWYGELLLSRLPEAQRGRD